MANQKQYAKAFEEWLRRHHEKPDRFAAEYPTGASGERSYGVNCAEYFAKLLREAGA